MKSGIPILVNRRDSLGDSLAFKIFPLQSKAKVPHRRQKTFDITEKLSYQCRMHDTIDAKKGNTQNRYRKISSSGGTSKFPRDFFRENSSATPVRIRLSRSKKQNISGSFFRLQLQDQKVYSCKKQTKKYRVQSPQVNCEQPNQVQTPKFNHKDLNQDQLLQQKSAKTKGTTNIQEYLSSRKQGLQRFFKTKKQPDIQQFNCQKQNKQKTQQQQDNQETPKDILLQTLGEDVNLLKEDLKVYKKISIRRKVSKSQKQNCQQTALVHKNIKEFLSTRGINQVMLPKINSVNLKLKEQKAIFKILIQKPRLTSLMMRKGLSQKFE